MSLHEKRDFVDIEKIKCSKCKKEVSEDSKFCNNCGTKVEKAVFKFSADDNLKLCSKLWYIIGFLRGSSLNDNKDSLVEFENIIKKDHSGMWEWYQEVINHWRDWAIKNDKELQKIVRSQQAGASETKRVQNKK